MCICQDDCSVRLSKKSGEHALQQDMSRGSTAICLPICVGNEASLVLHALTLPYHSHDKVPGDDYTCITPCHLR